MADRIIQTETLQSIANALRGGESQSASDKIDVADFAEVAEELKTDETYLKGLIEKTLVEIDIPSGVTTIATEAFKNVTTLEKVNIPSSVINIGISAFENCVTLEQVDMAVGVTRILDKAFYGCAVNLRKIDIPSSVTLIGQEAFKYCSKLAEISIPSSVTSIRNNAFDAINANAVINCGFAEGAVSGAPWGAPNTVTINYDVSN